MNNIVKLLIGVLVTALVLISLFLFVSPVICFATWAIVATCAFCYVGKKYIDDINKYEDVIEYHIDDTQKAIKNIEKLTKAEIFTYSDEVKHLIVFLRSYLQTLINYVNKMRELNG